MSEAAAPSLVPPTGLPNWRKVFVTIYSGQAFSLLGSAAVQFAIIWWLTVKTESAITLTMATLVAFIPVLFVGPFAGVVADRVNRRTIMMAADSFVALTSVVLGIAFFTWGDATPIWFIYLILFARGLGGAFHQPAMQAAIPQFVPVDMLTKVGGWGNLVASLSNMLGPVLGAALMGFMPIATIMLVDIFGALFAVVCLAFVRIPDVERDAEQEAPQVWADIKTGFFAAKGNAALWRLFPIAVLVNVVFMPLGSLFPLLVRTHFGGDALDNSLVEFVFAGGMLAASALLGVWGGMRRRFAMMSLAIIAMGITCAIGGLLPSHLFWVFVVGCFCLGATGPFFNVPIMAYVQETIAPEVMGKVFSLLMSGTSLAIPVGLLIAGPISEVIGVTAWFWYSGLIIALAGVWCALAMRRFDDELAQRPEPLAGELSED